MNVTTIGLDLAKSVFQVHGIDAHGKTLITRQLRRGKVLEFFANLPACLVGIEACPSAHHWAREISKLGHEVRLMPPGYVKPYVKRGKNDRADAEAICEAVQRPTMRFVSIKSEEQQALLVLHRVRETLVGQRIQLINTIRGHMAEFGIVAPRGAANVQQLILRLAEPDDTCIPARARAVLLLQVDQLRDTERRITDLDDQLKEQARQDESRQAPDDDPRGGAGRRDSDHGHARRWPRLRFRTPPGGVARPRAWTTLDRRQGTADRDHQSGRWLSAASAGQRGQGIDALVANPIAVADGAAGAPARERRHSGARQQDGARRLGRSGPRSGVSHRSLSDGRPDQPLPANGLRERPFGRDGSTGRTGDRPNPNDAWDQNP